MHELLNNSHRFYNADKLETRNRKIPFRQSIIHQSGKPKWNLVIMGNFI